MKLGVKLVVVISIVNLIGIGLLAGVTLIQSQREISRLAEEQVHTIARESSEKISKWLGKSVDVSKTLCQIMEGYQKVAVTERREYFDMMLSQVLAGNIENLGIWANWGPICLMVWTSNTSIPPGATKPDAICPVGLRVLMDCRLRLW
jgi:hypothetical protein